LYPLQYKEEIIDEPAITYTVTDYLSYADISIKIVKVPFIFKDKDEKNLTLLKSTIDKMIRE
jgi:hypothetical protein